MSEHTPLTDAEMLIMQRDAEVAGDSKKPYATDVLRLATDLREARRLLRALRSEAKALVSCEREELMDLVSATNVRCLENRIDEATAYLAACEGTEHDD